MVIDNPERGAKAGPTRICSPTGNSEFSTDGEALMGAALAPLDRYAPAPEPEETLSPDEAGVVTIFATLLPEGLDPDDETGLFLHLHGQGMPWRDIRKLAPFIAAKARELAA